MSGLLRTFAHILIALTTVVTTVSVPPLTVPSALAQGSYNAYKAVSAGYLHTCGITGTEVVRCWGSEEKIPVGLGQVSQISAGYYATCVIKKASEEAACWTDSDEEQYTSVPPSLGKVLEVSAGFWHACAVTIENEAKCWGNFERGYAAIPSNLGKIDHISVGTHLTCAITVEGDPRCWGLNPSVLSGAGKVKQISVGEDNHICTITLEDTLECWSGQAYEGKIAIPNGIGKVSQVESGDNFTCVLRLNETKVDCWGLYNLQDSSPVLNFQPVAVSAWNDHACAISASGSVQCWGDNWAGQSRPPAAIPLPNPPQFTFISDSLGSLKVWLNHQYDDSQGSLKWYVFEGETVVCLINLSGYCTVDLVPTRNYRFTVIGVNEAGETQPISKSVKFCPTQDAAIAISGNYLTKPNKKVTFKGSTKLSNLCNPAPKTIEYRKKVYGKSWTTWKTSKLNSSGGFSFSDSFEFNSKVELRAKLNGSSYTTKALSVPVAINYALPLSFYTKPNKTLNGYTQGGEITVKFGGDKAFNGTCTVLAQTDYAFNFALVSVGKESRFTSFKVKNGSGSGKVTMRWNGKVNISALCEDPRFVDIFDYRTPTFRTNF